VRIAELNAEWLAAAVGIDPARVADLDCTAVGTGQVADTYRLCFRVDGTPRSLVLKVTPDNPVSRQTGRGQASYLREVRFYQELAATLAVRVPQWRSADADDAGTEFHLLLEDMTPCRPGDQMAGCTLAEAEAVLQEAVGLHAPRWQDPAVGRLPWLKVNAAARRPGSDVYTMLFAAFRQRYADRIEDELMAVGAVLFPHIDAYYEAQRAAPQTVTHGDLRPDNLLFGGLGGQVPVTVVDWQTVDVGPGIADVSYFIGGALPAEVRRAHLHGPQRRPPRPRPGRTRAARAAEPQLSDGALHAPAQAACRAVGVNVTGSRLGPEMKLDASQAGSPARASPGSLVRISRSIAAICSRAKCDPRQ
jgi:hypothetical protein